MNPQQITQAACPNGHGGPPPEGGLFCTQCGSRFITMPVSSPAIPQAQAAGASNSAMPVAGYQIARPAGARVYCNTCGGEGKGLSSNVDVCPQCRGVRALAPGYLVDPSAFQWSQDGAAMAKLRSIGPLNAAARAISDKAGRRWVETTFNGIRLSEQQLPEVYALAVRAARLIGMPYMPEVYVSGDRMWDAMTFGSDASAFIVLGTALVTNFKGEDLLFLLAREMGHCRAGHALWKTVIRFLIGEQGPKKGLMAGGVLNALNPAHLIEGALELPLLAWARQAEITADRAGLLAIGDESTARRVLLSWSLKSTMLYRQINVDAWLEQQEDADDQATRLSEIASSSTPYITRRLKLMTQFAASAELQQWREVIGRVSRPVAPASLAQQKTSSQPSVKSAAANNDLRIACSVCKTRMRVPRAALAGKDSLNVRCPNAQCGKVVTLKKQVAAASPSQPPTPASTINESNTDSDY